jgi:GNAT superfamily N-acetyltransferase
MDMNRALPNDFTTEVLRGRATRVGSGDDSILLYRVTDDGEECAIVILDPEANDDALDLEEIFVRAECRGRGLGGAILARVEDIARDMTRRRVTAWAVPLDDDDDDDAKLELLGWYLKHGFARCTGRWDELEKLV